MAGCSCHWQDDNLAYSGMYLKELAQEAIGVLDESAYWYRGRTT